MSDLVRIHIVGFLMTRLNLFNFNTCPCGLFLVVKGGTYPPLPKLPPQFQTRVEANLIDKGLTITAKEYYDQLGNRAAVHTIQNNTEDYMILDYTNDQIYSITSKALFSPHVC